MKGRRALSWWLIVTAAVCGAVVMAVELLGARMLSVGYGGSLSVWAAMISTTLISLAIGYFAGGCVADRAPKPWILFLLVTLGGALVVVCPHLRFVLKVCYHAMGIKGGALASSAIIFLAPLGLLGVVGPFVIRLLSDRPEGVGMTAGGIYAISTIGSVAGTLLTALWLIPTLGVSEGFLLTGIAASACGAVGLILCLKRKGAVAALAPMVLAFVPNVSNKVGETFVAPDGEPAQILDVRDSALGRIAVVSKGDYRLLVVNGIVQTGVPKDMAGLAKGDGLAIHYFQELLPYTVENPESRSALVIGVAGGMTPALLRAYGIQVDAVDLDPAIIETARKWFSFFGPATIMDGRLYLEDCKKRYDFCVLDTYSGDAMPFHLASREAFQSAAAVLKPGGVLAINYIGAPKGRAFASIYKTLSAVFLNVKALKGEANDKIQTITIFASNRPITFNNGWLDYRPAFSGVDPIGDAIARMTVEPSMQDAIVLTDEYNPIDLLRDDEALQWRMRAYQNIGEKVVF